MVAAVVPTMTGHRARDPRAIRAPGGHTCGRPENGNTLRVGQQSKAKPRCYEIYDADRDSEPNRATPPHQIDAGGQLMLNRSS